MNVSAQNKRIAKNTFLLYARKALTLFITLYASRVLLQYLGVDNFGLYGVVGSIVVMFSALRSMFASSIQRYLNVDKEGSAKSQNEIFCAGVMIHLFVALIFLIVVEIAGMLMIGHLNIQPERLDVAIIVLQFSIFTAIVSILTVPYDAVIMAKERFDAYALFAIIDALLRLGIIFLLLISPMDKLVFYALLLFAEAVVMRLINLVYCKINFHEETKFRFKTQPGLIRKMAKFAGWNFFGNLGYSLTNEGVNILLNLFGGITANAARSIAHRVNMSLSTFVRDLTTPMTPQSMQAFAAENHVRFYNLQFFGAKATFIVTLMIALPIFICAPEVLQLWFGETPRFSIAFVRCILLYNLVRTFHGPLDVLFKAAGKMKHYQLCEIIVMTMNLPIIWIVLKSGAQLFWAFIIMAIIESINLAIIMLIASRKTGFDIAAYLRRVIIPCLASLATVAVILFITILLIKYFATYAVQNPIVNLIVVSLVSLSGIALFSWLLILTADERQRILALLLHRKSK